VVLSGQLGADVFFDIAALQFVVVPRSGRFALELGLLLIAWPALVVAFLVEVDPQGNKPFWSLKLPSAAWKRIQTCYLFRGRRGGICA